MSFFEEIGSLLGLDWARLAQGYSAVNYNGEAVYLEGIKKVVSLSDTEIIFCAGKGRVKITGENLGVFSLEEKTAVIKGTILSISEGQ